MSENGGAPLPSAAQGAVLMAERALAAAWHEVASMAQRIVEHGVPEEWDSYERAEAYHLLLEYRGRLPKIEMFAARYDVADRALYAIAGRGGE
jgi:hypothetical protein